MPYSIKLLFNNKVELYNNILIVSLFLAILSGAFSFERVTDSKLNLPIFLLELRFILSSLFLVLLLGKMLAFKQIRLVFARPLYFWLLISTLFFIYMCLTVYWAPSSMGISKRVPGLLLIIFFIVSIPLVFDNNINERIGFVLLLITLTSVIYVVGGIVTDNLIVGRMSAFGGGPNVFARVVGMGVISALFLWVRYNEKIWLLFVPLFASITLLSGSRGGLLALVVGATIFLYFISRYQISKLLILFPSLAIGSLFVWFNSSIYELVVYTWTERIYHLTFVQKYTTRRDILFDTAWYMFESKPILGNGLYAFAIQGGTEVDYPHNLFLEAASEGGLVALSLLLTALVIISFKVRSLRSLEQQAMWSLGILYFIASQFSGSLYDTRFMWVFWAICLTAIHRDKKLDAMREYARFRVDPRISLSNNMLASTRTHKCI